MDVLCSVSWGLLFTLKFFFIHKILVNVFDKLGKITGRKNALVDEASKTWFTHTLSKAVLNIAVCAGMLAMAVYTLTLNEVVKNPYSTHVDNLKFLVTPLNFLLAYNFFNLLEATPTLKQLHQWNFTIYLTSLILVTVSFLVLVRRELAILGVVCLFMSGSSLSDHVLLIVRLFTQDKIKKIWITRAYICCISNHLFCNCICPVAILLLATFSSNENVLEMTKTTIIIFFTVMILLIVTNCWRLLRLLSDFCLRHEDVSDVMNGSDSDSGYILSVSSEHMSIRITENNDYV